MEIKDKVTTTYEEIEHEDQLYRRYENGYWEVETSGHWYECYDPDLEKKYKAINKNLPTQTFDGIRGDVKDLSNEIIRDWEAAGDYEAADAGRYLLRNIMDQLKANE